MKTLLLGLSLTLFLIGNSFAQTGSLDATFDTDGKLTTTIGSSYDYCKGIAIQPDGKIVVAGNAIIAGNNDFFVARYNPDGTLDDTFDNDGIITTAIGSGDDNVSSLLLQPDGKIVVGGSSYNGTNNDFALVRYNTNGSLDNTFDTDGKVTTAFDPNGNDNCTSITIQSDGKIVAVGEVANVGVIESGIVRYNSNGSLDNTFWGGGKRVYVLGYNYSSPRSVAIQTDGKIVFGGYIASVGILVVRINANGTDDNSFNGGGKIIFGIGSYYNFGLSIALQTNGKIVIAGKCNSGSMNDYNVAVARLNTDGTLDNTFDSDGKVETAVSGSNDSGESVFIQPDGKILVAGTDGDNFCIVRYNPNGSLDNTFDTDGIAITDFAGGIDYGYALDLQSDSKIVVAGTAFNGAKLDIALARYLNDCVSATTPTIAAGGSTTFCSGGSVSFNTTGNAGNSLKLNGTNQNANFGGGLALQNFTVSMWVKPGATQNIYADILDNNHNSGRSWVLQQNMSTTNQYLFGGGWAGTPPTFNLTANVWQHVALVSTSSTRQVYVNGVLVSNQTGVSAITYDGTEFLRAGMWGGSGRYWNGEMDELRVYNTALSLSQIQAEMNVVVSPSSPNLIRYYHMNESSGTVVTDATGNMHGSIINAPTFQTSGAPINYNTYLWQPNGETTSTITGTTSGNYYVTVTSADVSCSAVSNAITVNSIAYPSAPTSGGNLNVCSNSLPATISVTPPGGSTVDWYSASTSGTLLLAGSNSYSTSTAGTYYAESKTTTGGCISTSRTAVTLTITPLPAAPTSGGNQGTCSGITTTISATPPANCTIDWYNASSGGTLLQSGSNSYSTSTPGIYYAETRDTAVGCTSTTRTGVTLSLLTTTATVPTTVAQGPTTFCAGGDVILGTSGNSGYAIKFNGSGQYANFGAGLNLQNFTVSMWVKPGATQVNYANIVDNNHSATRSWVLQQNNNILNQYLFGGNWTTASTFNLTANVWQHVALVSTSTTRQVYVNGVLVVNQSGLSAINYDGTEYFRAGRWGGGSRNWNGEMDELRVYNTALSQAQIQAEMNVLVSPSSPNLIRYYHMNEGSGTVLNDATGSSNGSTIMAPIFITSGATIDYNSYLWLPGGYTTTTITANASGNYYVTVTSADASCASTSDTISVTSIALPAAPVSGGNQNVCSTAMPVTLTVTPPNGSTVDWYSASTGGTLLLSGNNSYSASTAGTYYAESKTTFGSCTSTNRTNVDLTVTANTINQTVTFSSNTLTSNDTLATAFQWIDCNNNNAPIANETNQTFAPTLDGDYAVIVYKGPCVDTSNCYHVILTGINRSVVEKEIQIYPNPTFGKFKISGLDLQASSIEIINAAGEQVYSSQSKSINPEIDLSEQGKGVYLLLMKTEKGIQTKKIVVF